VHSIEWLKIVWGEEGDPCLRLCIRENYQKGVVSHWFARKKGNESWAVTARGDPKVG